MRGLWQDIRLAVRLLAKDRRFTLAAVVALGLGIGLNTSVFSIINTSFLRDLPLPAPRRLIAIQWRDSHVATPGRDISGRSRGSAVVAVSIEDLRDWREQTASFEGLAANTPGAMILSDDGAPAEQFRGSYLTANTFRVLRVAPLLGRDFAAEDETPGAPGVLMLGYDAWQHRYGGDPSVIGRSVRVNDVPATIIGVMPPDFRYPAIDHMWQTISSSPTFAKATRNPRNLSVVGRLRNGVELSLARQELDAIAGRLAAAFPATHKDLVSFARPLRELYPTPPLDMIVGMMAAVAFVLLIAYANLANLLLARSIRRAREIAVRIALGASRPRVMRQLLVECVLIGVAGGALGLALSFYGVREIAAAYEPIEAGTRIGSNRPYWVDLSPNAFVFAFVGLLSVGSALAFGLLPAWQTSKTDVNETLKAESRSAGNSRRSRRWAGVLLTAQLALTLTLLSSAGLMFRAFLTRYWQDTMIDTSGIVTMRLALPATKYGTPDDRRRFFDLLHQRLSSITAFSGVTIASHVPLEWGAPTRELIIDGVATAPGEKPPRVSYLLTGSNYFTLLKLPIARGRGIEPQDSRPGQEGAVVDERFATRFFPYGDPIGRRIRLGASGTWYTVVGIARTLPHIGPAPELRPVVYAAFGAEPAPDGRGAIIVKGPLEAASAALRDEIRAIDPSLPLFAIETLDTTVARGRIPERTFSTWFGAVALVALVLAAVGVFAITAHSVVQRTHEMGVRMALGADGRTVVRLFLRRTMVQLTGGIVLGLAGALAVGRLANATTRDAGSGDPVTLAIVSALLAAVALMATLLPARRAARVDPMVALRAE
jgi:predicted permease